MAVRSRFDRPDDGIDAKSLPHNLEAERSVLGALVVHNDAWDRVQAVLTSDSFYRLSHRVVWTAMERLFNQRSAVDFVTLMEELRRAGQLEDAGGVAYVSGLGDGVPRSVNVEHYARIVAEKHRLRLVIHAANQALVAAYAGEATAAEIATQADAQMLALQHGRTHGTLRSLQSMVPELMAYIEQRMEHPGEVIGVTTGWQHLDELTYGWQAGDLVVAAARPSMGKTTLAMNSAVAAASKDAKVAVFSMEMRQRQLAIRLLGQLSGVAMERMRSGYIGSVDLGRLASAFDHVGHLPIYINDAGGQTAQDIRASCRRMKAEIGLDLIVVDYVQLMDGSLARKGANRNEEITDISKRLKDLAAECHVPLILVSQLRRQEGRPKLDDLRESGALEQACDVAVFLHRKHHGASGLTELIVAKQRNGPLGTLYLDFDRDTNTLRQAEAPTPQEQAASAADEAQATTRTRSRTFAMRARSMREGKDE